MLQVSDEEQVQRNLAEMYSEMIGSPVYTTDFMGQPYRAGDPIPVPACGGTSERGSHISVHRWVGDPREDFNEDLGNSQPLFPRISRIQITRTPPSCSTTTTRGW